MTTNPIDLGRVETIPVEPTELRWVARVKELEWRAELARSVLAGRQLRCRACRAVDTARDDVLARYLLQLERLCNAATPGPWTLDDETDCRVFAPGGELICDCDIVGVDVPVRFMRVDAAFIAAARRAVPALIAEVRALQAQLDHATRGCEVDDD